ncbi:MAG: peptidylprolyl isomerase, partial [Bacteroidota bacterium]
KRVAIITYVLTNADTKEMIQVADEENPFAFIHGIGQVLPAFDANLEGKVKGDEYTFSLEAKDAYGEYNPQNIESLDLKIFAEAPPEYIQPGRTLPMEYNGNTVFGTITEVTDKEVKMDFNHPLAGKNLNFTGKVIEVREATEEELAHGHVHGPGGVEH